MGVAHNDLRLATGAMSGRDSGVNSLYLTCPVEGNPRWRICNPLQNAENPGKTTDSEARAAVGAAVAPADISSSPNLSGAGSDTEQRRSIVSEHSTADTCDACGESALLDAECYPSIARIAASWQFLPPHVREAIITLVDASLSVRSAQ